MNQDISNLFEDLKSVELDVWVDGWDNEWTHVKITKNLITFDLIQIIQFWLKIDDLCRYLHAHTTHWSQPLAIEFMNIIHSLTV